MIHLQAPDFSRGECQIIGLVLSFLSGSMIEKYKMKRGGGSG
jgi:hypothetical protein